MIFECVCGIPCSSVAYNFPAAEEFRATGVVHVPSLLSASTLRALEDAYAYCIEHPSSGASHISWGGDRIVFQRGFTLEASDSEHIAGLLEARGKSSLSRRRPDLDTHYSISMAARTGGDSEGPAGRTDFVDNNPGEDRQHIWHDIIASSPEMQGLLHTLFDASSEEVYFLGAQLFLREGGDEEDRTMTRTGWHQVRPPDTPTPARQAQPFN